MIDRAVVNAGPLVALSFLELLHLLPSLFSECWIPKTVFNEVSVAGVGKPGATSLNETEWKSRIKDCPRVDPLLVMELDPGEAEVITLARNFSPCMALIDERRGRRIARHVYGLPVKGTAGILVEAKRHGFIQVVRPYLLELRLSNYYIADKVLDAACKEAGE